MKKEMLTKLKKYQKILTNEHFRILLKEYEKDFELKQVNKENIILIKENEYCYEVVKIHNDSFVNHTICEVRENGIILTQLKLSFDYTIYSKKQKQLVHLAERRYVLTNSKLKKLFNNISHLSISDLHDKLSTIPLILSADMKTYFTTYIDYRKKDNKGNYVQKHKLFTKVFLNGDDISNIYNYVNGNDRLYRVYDLYNGILNERNNQDIQNISNNILPQEAFDYKKTSGITEKENVLVGESLIKNNDQKTNLAKENFLEKTKVKKHTKIDVLDDRFYNK